MTRFRVGFALAFTGFSLFLPGCATTSAYDYSKRMAEFHPETIILPSPVDPRKLRFEIEASFPVSTPEIESSLPSNKKVAAAWRLFAARKLREEGLCPYGFSGPEVTFWRKYKNQTWFDIECLPPPS